MLTKSEYKVEIVVVSLERVHDYVRPMHPHKFNIQKALYFRDRMWIKFALLLWHDDTIAPLNHDSFVNETFQQAYIFPSSV